MRVPVDDSASVPRVTRYRWGMEPNPGDATPRAGALIVGACAVTIALAFYGMKAMWEGVEWVQDPYLVGEPTPGRSHFWYTNGLGLAMCVAVALAWLPRFRISQLLRVAVVLPVLHVAAIGVAARVWSIFDADALEKLARPHMADYFKHPTLPLPTISALAIAFAAWIAIAIALKRRHGEWAHATMMLALSNLLLLGLWLPLVARLAVRVEDSDYYWRDNVERVLDPSTVAQLALIPPAILAIVFTAIVFRAPRLYERYRRHVRIALWSLFAIAMFVAVSLPDQAWLVYFESSYLVMSAVVVAVAALVMLVCTSWLRSLRTRWRSRKLTYQTGVIADDEHGEAARFEITSWLRGPRLATRPFVVTTAQGNIPVAGAMVLAPVPHATTLLDVGEHAAVLRPGDRVVIAGRSAAGDGHPFRASDATEISLVTPADARLHRFSDVVLVAWRPALAYLTIVVAVALPYLSIFLTD
jgi:hypothetical protein